MGHAGLLPSGAERDGQLASPDQAAAKLARKADRLPHDAGLVERAVRIAENSGRLTTFGAHLVHRADEVDRTTGSHCHEPPKVAVVRPGVGAITFPPGRCAVYQHVLHTIAMDRC